MAGGAGRGLFRKKNGTTWHVRRAVPPELRVVFQKHEWIKSLQTADSQQAERRRDDFWRLTDEDVSFVRARSLRPLLTLEGAQSLIGAWRRERCTRALQDVEAGVLDLQPFTLPSGAFKALERSFTVDPRAPQPRKARVGSDVAQVAREYFDRNPGASRDPGVLPPVSALLRRLEAVARDEAAWSDVEGFDAHLDAALEEAGGADRVLPSVRAELRTDFALAWRDVAQHEEAQRQRAVAFLGAVKAADLDPNALRPRQLEEAYIPREGDKTVADLISAYRSDRISGYDQNSIAGEESTDRKYKHVFSALEEALGGGTPIRAITVDDAARVRDLIRIIPAHMGKRYPGLSMMAAIDVGRAAGAQTLAANTVNTYTSNLIAMMNWAAKRGWIESNPAAGLVTKSRPQVKRRGFSAEELERLFSDLEKERYREAPWKFWIPALGLYTGARLNEICQLLSQDVKEEAGVNFVDITPFDASGVISQEKRLKNKESERRIPLHPALIDAGFLEFARGRAGRRLFHELPRGPNDGYSHMVSKWFGGALDRVGCSGASLVFHSFRHGFRDACDEAEIPEPLINALGGWATRSVSDRYGNRKGNLPLLYGYLAKVQYGAFTLSPKTVG